MTQKDWTEEMKTKQIAYSLLGYNVIKTIGLVYQYQILGANSCRQTYHTAIFLICDSYENMKV